MTDGTAVVLTPVASFTKEVNRRLAKWPLKTNGRLANRRLSPLVKETTVWGPRCQQSFTKPAFSLGHG